MKNMIDHINGNFFSGIVVRVDDPLLEGRVAVNIPSLSLIASHVKEEIKLSGTGQGFTINDSTSITSKLESSNYLWARPTNFVEANENSMNLTNNGGKYKVPKIGTNIVLFFMDNDPQKLYYMDATLTVKGELVSGKNIKDTDTWASATDKHLIQMYEFTNEDILEHNDKLGYLRFAKTAGYEAIIVDNDKEKEFKVKTPSGHMIKLDEKNNNNFHLNTASGHIMIMSDKDAIIKVTTAGGHILSIDDKGKKISLTSTGGNSVVINDNTGNIEINSNGKTIVNSGGNTTVNAGGNAEVNASKMIVNCDMNVNGNIKCMDLKGNNIKGTTIRASASSDNKHGHQPHGGW